MEEAVGQPDRDPEVFQAVVGKQQGRLEMSFRLFILFVIAAGLYLGSLSNGFLWDDDRIILNNGSIRHLKTAIRWGGGVLGQRPVTNLSFAVDHALWGLWPGGYHLTQILLHGLNTMLVFFLAQAVLGQTHVQGCAGALARGRNCPPTSLSPAPPGQRGSPSGAWWAGLIFAAHPVHTEAVAAFLGRSDLLMTAFFLGAFLLYRRAIAASGVQRLLLYGGTLSCCLLSLLSKEMGIVLPACLGLYEALVSFQGRWGAWWRARWPFFLIALLAVSAYFACWMNLMGQSLTSPKFWGGSLYRTSLAMILVLAEYVRLLLFPLKLCCWYKASIPASPWSPAVVISAALLLGILGATFYLSRRIPPLVFGIGWLLITLLPVSNLLPIAGSMMAERWLYLPSVGFCLLLGGLIEISSKLKAQSSKQMTGSFELTLNTAPHNKVSMIPQAILDTYLRGALLKKGEILLLVTLLTFYAVRVITRNPVWRDSRTLFQQALADCPPSELIHNNLGEVYQKEGQGDLAFKEYRQALALSPNAMEAKLNLASLSLDRGDVDGAIAQLEPLVRWDVQMAKPYRMLAQAYARKGAYAKAEEYYRIALQLNPTLVEAHYEMGNLYQAMGRLDLAERQWREALILRPNLAQAHNQLGNVYLLWGKLGQAVEEYQRAIQLDRANIESHYNLALALERLGRWPEARRHYQSFLGMAPAEYAGQKALIRQKLARGP